MKKALKSIAALAASVMALSSAAGITASASQYGSFTYSKGLDGKIQIENCTTTNKAVYVPYKIEGKQISRIKKGAFVRCSLLRYVILNGSSPVIEVGTTHQGTCYFCNSGANYTYYVDNTPVYCYNFGDYNEDGTVDLLDAQAILRHYTTYTVAGKKYASELEYARYLAVADVDRNGEIGIEDVQLVLQYYTEVIAGMPAFPLMEYVYSMNNGPI
ncbi:MAG: hypothetical protein J6Z45_01540 [Oscillospiraceae bacterium]|nr:hypothetical protein [Oscillospiraceae bacterium]